MKRLRPWGLLLAGAVALPISFAGFDQWYLAWVAFVPLLFAIEGVTRRQAAARGFVYGLVANMIGYYWIPQTIHDFGEFPWTLAWLFGTVLCAYQAIQFALLAYLVVRMREARCSVLWALPAAMVALEVVYPLLFPIFMGNTQHPVTSLIQACDLLGPLLLTAVVLFFNAALYVAIRSLLARERPPWKWLALAPASIVLLLVYGELRGASVRAQISRAPTLRVGLVQPNMGSEQKWEDPAEGIRRHDRASRDLERQGAELIIWSEASYVGGYIMPDARNLRRDVSHGLRVPLLFGALTRHEREGRRFSRNSAIMLDARGNVMGIYDKTYLLAFGEYLPFGEVFPELYEYTPHSGRMAPGSSLDPLPFEHRGRTWNIGPLICYEDIIPRFTRSIMNHDDVHLLVNLTNDVWFGDTNEPWIHLALAKFRAVEHRRYLVRATNSGVSAIIDPTGRVVQHTGAYERATLLGTVRLLEGRTVYARTGDLIGYLAILVVAVVVWRTRQVWLRSPPDGRTISGIVQPAAILLAVAIVDLLSWGLLAVLQPAGWRPTPFVTLAWLGSALAMIAGFVLLRRRSQRGLHLAWLGSALRLLLTAVLVGSVSEERRSTVAALLGTPTLFVALCAITLYLWRAALPTAARRPS